VAKLCYYFCAPYLKNPDDAKIEDFMPPDPTIEKKKASPEEVASFFQTQAAIINNLPQG